MENNVARRVLARAAAGLGGVEALASRLGIGASRARHYIGGSEPVPDALLLLAVDVILEELSHDPAAIRRAAHSFPQPRPQASRKPT